MSEPNHGATAALPAPDAAPVQARAPQKRRSGFWDVWREGWLGIFLLLIIAAALGALIARLWPLIEGNVLAPSEDLQARLLKIEQTIAANPADGRTATALEVQELRTRVTQLEDRVRSAETTLASAKTVPVEPDLPGAPAGAPAPSRPVSAQAETPSGSTAAAPEPVTGETTGTALAADPQKLAEVALRLDAAMQMLDTLEKRITSVEAKPSGSADSTAATAAAAQTNEAAEALLQPLKAELADARTALTAVTTRLDELAVKIGAQADAAPLITAVRTDLDAVSTRVTKIEQADLQGSAKRAALGAAVASLTRAAQTGQGFKAELDMVAGLNPDDPSLSELMPHAARGVQTLSQLNTSFARYAQAALAAEHTASGSDPLWRLWGSMTTIVSVRPTGDVAGENSAARLARAEARTKAGDVAAALDELKGLSGPARTSMSPWIEAAQARATLDAALSSLNTRVVQSLTQNSSL